LSRLVKVGFGYVWLGLTTFCHSRVLVFRSWGRFSNF